MNLSPVARHNVKLRLCIALPILWLAACTDGEQAAAPDSESTADVVKTVNNVDIDQHTLDFYIETRFRGAGANITDEQREIALNELVDIYLLTTQPKALELAKEPRTAAQLELQRRGMLAQILANDFMSSNEATEEDLQQAYEEQIAESPKFQYKARHILVEQQETAAEIIASLDAGADFAELAKEKSTGPSGPNGGDLGWFSPDQMVKPFSDAVTALENGSYTKEPVQTQFGWHVVLREDSRENEPPTLESLRDVLKQRIAQEKFQSYLESLRDDGSS